MLEEVPRPPARTTLPDTAVVLSIVLLLVMIPDIFNDPFAVNTLLTIAFVIVAVADVVIPPVTDNAAPVVPVTEIVVAVMIGIVAVDAAVGMTRLPPRYKVLPIDAPPAITMEPFVRFVESAVLVEVKTLVAESARFPEATFNAAVVIVFATPKPPAVIIEPVLVDIDSVTLLVANVDAAVIAPVKLLVPITVKFPFAKIPLPLEIPPDTLTAPVAGLEASAVSANR